MGKPPEPMKTELTAQILAGARHAAALSASDRRVNVMYLIEQCLDTRLEMTEEIFELAYGDRSGRAYWSGWLTDDFSPLFEFVRLLEIHSGKARDLLYISRSPILEAFSIASRARPIWLRHASGEAQDLGRSNHPQHLAGWMICRGQAAGWLLQHSEFQDLLPPQVVDALRGRVDQSDHASVIERITPQKIMCQEAFTALYPDGIPSQGHTSNKKLAGEVQDYIRSTNRTPPSQDTICRSAGRKSSKAG